MRDQEVCDAELLERYVGQVEKLLRRVDVTEFREFSAVQRCQSMGRRVREIARALHNEADDLK